MSGFSYIIIKSDSVEPDQLIKALELGQFQHKGKTNGEAAFSHFGHEDIWVSNYKDYCIINNFKLCFGIFNEQLLSFEEKLIALFPNTEIGTFLFRDKK